MEKSQHTRYSLQEIAAQLRIHVPHLRYLERQFKEIHPQRAEDGSFHYRIKDVLFFRTIYYLIYNKNYTLHKVKRILAENAFDVIATLPDNESILEKLTNKPSVSEFDVAQDKNMAFDEESFDTAMYRLGEIVDYPSKNTQQLLASIMQEVLACKRLLEDI